MGARPEDYEALLPPGSFIHVDDFRSPKHLAEYLQSLDKNDELYNAYFKWKDSWIPVVDRSAEFIQQIA
jgi:glycoprotein 3-alpha-L-fucosyltransferase